MTQSLTSLHHGLPTPRHSPEPANLTLAQARRVSTSSPDRIPAEIKENTFYISVSAFYDEPSIYPCILECYNAAAKRFGTGVMVQQNNRHFLLKQWLAHAFQPGSDSPRALLVDAFFGRLVRDLYDDKEFNEILATRRLQLVYIEPFISLNNKLNIPFELTDAAFKEYAVAHSGESLDKVDLASHTECCYNRAVNHGFSLSIMQRSWAPINLAKVWRKVDCSGVQNEDYAKRSIQEEMIRIQHAWEAIGRTKAWIDEREKELQTNYQKLKGECT